MPARLTAQSTAATGATFGQGEAAMTAYPPRLTTAIFNFIPHKPDQYR
jgi:hypothetical protein